MLLPGQSGGIPDKEPWYEWYLEKTIEKSFFQVLDLLSSDWKGMNAEERKVSELTTLHDAEMGHGGGRGETEVREGVLCMAGAEVVVEEDAYFVAQPSFPRTGCSSFGRSFAVVLLMP